MVHQRTRSGAPGRTGVDLKVLDGLIAEKLQAVAALDQRHAFGRQALQFDRSNFGAVLLALALALRLFVVVEFAFDPVCGAVEEVDGRPEQILEVRFEPGVAQGGDQGVEDVGDGAGDHLALGKRSRIGFVVERTVAEELQFGEDVVGRRWACGGSMSS